MRIAKSKIRQIIREELAAVSMKSRLSKSSIDGQIDGMLIKFEENSIEEEEENNEFQESKFYSLRRLFEAPEDEEEKGDEAAQKPGNDFVDDSKIKAKKAVDVPKPNLNVDKFAVQVARLIQNMSSLLDIEGVILQRSINYLKKNYDQSVVDAFEETLEDRFGIALTPKDNEPAPTAAVGAGPSVG